MIIDQLKDSMPPLPAYKGKYRAIYLEPIAYSGENLCIGIMAQGENTAKVIQTISNKKLKCMYGESANAIKNLITLIIESANKHIDLELPIEDWQPPFTGVTAAETRHTRYQNNFDNILYQAVTNFSSLYDGHILDNISQLINDDDQEQDEATTHLITTIKSNLGKAYQARFKQKVKLMKGDTITIDYLGLNLNADIANFDVSNIANAERFAKAKLLDIETLRNEREHETIMTSVNFGFFIFEPEIAKKKATISIKQIAHAAESRDIDCHICQSPDQVAEIIKEKDPVN